jgi:hypothetical protein
MKQEHSYPPFWFIFFTFGVQGLARTTLLAPEESLLIVNLWSFEGAELSFIPTYEVS